MHPLERPASAPVFGHDTQRAARFRLLAPVVLCALVQLPAAVVVPRPAERTLELRLDEASLLGLLIALVGPIALLFARRAPGPVVAVVSAAALLDLFLGRAGAGAPYLALAFAIGGAVLRGARGWAWISVGAAWIVAIPLAALLRSDWPPGRIAVTTLGILLVFGVAEAMRGRRDRFRELRRERARLLQDELQAERVRIARELHDVLAHSLSSINVQAGVGLHLMQAHPEQAGQALANIKEASSSALADVRAVLGVLRADAAGGAEDAPLRPEPDLGRLPELLEPARQQGLEVRLVAPPESALHDVPAPVQLAAYRIVQESLTNVLRHADARAASVTVRRIDTGRESPPGEHAIEVEVRDDGRGFGADAVRSSDGGGRGLLGMRERAELLGGALRTGAAPGGGFEVAARLPFASAAQSVSTTEGADA